MSERSRSRAGSCRPLLSLGLLLAAGIASSCGQEGPGKHNIAPGREVAPVGEDFDWNASTTERLGLRSMSAAMGGADSDGGSSGDLAWSTPSGWKELPPQQFRDVNFLVAGDPEVQCYLSIVGGSVVANVNRWRNQFSLPALSAAEVDALPRAALLGMQAPFVDVKGTFSGMGDGAEHEDHRLLGIVLERGEKIYTLKLVGPADAIESQKAAFLALAASFREKEGASGTVAAASGGALHWKTPAGWSELPTQQFRDANFRVAGDARVECYLSMFPNDTGGLVANVNRWRHQLSLEPITAEEADALPTTPFFGGAGTLLEIDGTFAGMGGGDPQSGYRLLGVLAFPGGQARFFKMVGPADVVAAQKQAFLDVAASFEEGGPSQGPVVAASGAGDGNDLSWQTPPGWQELAPKAFRDANFLVSGDARAECYLTRFAESDGGGLAANINRWRSQLSLPAATPEEIAALPTTEFFGEDGTLLDVEGTYVGMRNQDPVPGYRFVGIALVHPDRAWFLRMVGPKEVIDPQVDSFLALAASFKESGAAPTPAPTVPEAAAGATDDTAAGMAWKTPQGWRRQPDRMGRAVTFTVGSEDDVECYVAVLGGSAGGAFANANRWCSQMNAPQLTQEEFDALPKVTILGTEGVVVEAVGTYEGMGDKHIEDAKLLGAICILPDRSVFVKMIGPAAHVDAEHDAFLSFCRSLSSAG